MSADDEAPRRKILPLEENPAPPSPRKILPLEEPATP